MESDRGSLFEQDTTFLQAVSHVSGLCCATWIGPSIWHSDICRIHPLQSDPVLLGKITEACQADMPGIFMENEFVFWGLMRAGLSAIAVGPALLNRPYANYDKDYAASHGLGDAIALRRLSLRDMAECLSLISIHCFGMPLTLDALVNLGEGTQHISWKSEGDFLRYYVDQSEYDRTHKGGRAFERVLAEAVRDGDVEQVKTLLSGAVPNVDDGGIISEDTHKQVEYMLVSLITILTRAAEEGGLPSETAHEVGDVYLKRLAAESRNGGVVTTLGNRAMVEFAELVRKAKQTRSSASHVEACKAYIEENLLKDMQIGDIAPALGLSRTYLAHLFKQTEGLSVQQYIQREKCRKAEGMLQYSDYPLSMIAEYLGFSSPGYFSNCFKQWYGITPRAYRKIHAAK